MRSSSIGLSFWKDHGWLSISDSITDFFNYTFTAETKQNNRKSVEVGVFEERRSL